MSAYTRELVEQLLPAVWDQSLAYGMTNPTAPDPDMPRATPDPAQSNTLYAHLADIRTGWTQADLTPPDRRVLLLYCGLDWPRRKIARHEHLPETTTSERLARGIGTIVAHLNGTTHDDEQPDGAHPREAPDFE